MLPEVVKNILIINVIMYIATLVLESKGVDLNDILGLHYYGSEKFRVYQLITYMFMHGSWAHILLNMFAAWMFGSAIENTWGPKRFLTYYILTGLGAALAQFAIVHIQLTPVISALNDYLAHPSEDALGALLNSGKLGTFSSQEMYEHINTFLTQFNDVNQRSGPEALQLSVDFMQQLRMDILNAPVVIGASGAVYGVLLAYGMLYPNNLLYVYFVVPIRAKYFVIIFGLIEL